MNVKVCRICGYELDRKAQRCSWCKTPVKKIPPRHYFISALIIFSIFILLVALSKKNDSPGISSSRKQISASAMKTAPAQQPISIPKKPPAKVNVKEEIGTLRQPSKDITPYQDFRAFRKYFKRLNAEIKIQKGMAFFENVEYLDNGVIEVTATDIFLSAPETYQQSYLRKMEQKWLDLREPSPQATVRIVDSEGVLRMEKKRG